MDRTLKKTFVLLTSRLLPWTVNQIYKILDIRIIGLIQAHTQYVQKVSVWVGIFGTHVLWPFFIDVEWRKIFRVTTKSNWSGIGKMENYPVGRQARRILGWQAPEFWVGRLDDFWAGRPDSAVERYIWDNIRKIWNI